MNIEHLLLPASFAAQTISPAVSHLMRWASFNSMQLRAASVYSAVLDHLYTSSCHGCQDDWWPGISLVRSKSTTEKVRHSVGHCKLVMQASLHIPALPSAMVPGATHGPLMYIYPSYIRDAKLLGWRLLHISATRRACSPRTHLQGQSPPLCVCHISGRAPRCAMAAPPSPQTAPRSRTRRSRT